MLPKWAFLKDNMGWHCVNMYMCLDQMWWHSKFSTRWNAPDFYAHKAVFPFVLTHFVRNGEMHYGLLGFTWKD